MRAVIVEVPESLLEERRRTGAEMFDEMWDGVLHMVLSPSGTHQRFGVRLLVALAPLADAKGLIGLYETNMFRVGAIREDYRIPDLVFVRPEHFTPRGVEGGAELAVEIRSPHDETYDKFGFYAEVGVHELLVADPLTCTVELYRLSEGSLQRVMPDQHGVSRSSALDVAFSTVDGPAMRVEWLAGSVEITGWA